MPELCLLASDFMWLISWRMGLGENYLRPLNEIRGRHQEKIDIVFVCKGNICRSPYAEARLQALLDTASLRGVSVRSAGVETTPGKPADPMAVLEAKKRGVSLAQHETARLSEEMIAGSDLVMLMDAYHLKELKRRYPESVSKSMYLGALLFGRPGGLNIRDPYGREPKAFKECFERIDQALANLVKLLLVPLH